MKRLLFGLAAALVAVAAVSAVVAGGGLTTSSATAASPGNGLFAYVRAGTRGPLNTCESNAANCIVWNYIYVSNLNQVSNAAGGTRRDTLPNSYVVNSVSSATFVDGAPYTAFDATFTPAPYPFTRGWAGHWPTTVTCQPSAPPDPCNEIHDPAVIPGENTSILYTGWAHSAGEPNGTYVFKFTIHGTLNGNPVDLTASSPPIQMTG